MHQAEGIAALPQIRQRDGLREPAARFGPRRQVDAAQELHHQVSGVVLLEIEVDADDARMVQTVEFAGLAQEALDRAGIDQRRAGGRPDGFAAANAAGEEELLDRYLAAALP